MVEIRLADGGRTQVDDFDALWLAEAPWHRDRAGHVVTPGWGRWKGTLLRMDHLIARTAQVRHRDGNPLNNCRSNLQRFSFALEIDG